MKIQNDRLCNLLFSGIFLINGSIGYFFLFGSRWGNLFRISALAAGLVCLLLAGWIGYCTARKGKGLVVVMGGQ